MLTQVHDLDVTPTATPLEAALLESDEIKRFHPPYNVQLRERDADVYFASHALDDASPRPDARRVLGPFPTANALAGLESVRALLARPTDDVDLELWASALELGDDAVLDEECLAAGLAACRTAGRFEAGALPASGALLGWGTRLWRAWVAARLAAREAAEEVSHDLEAAEGEAEPDEEEARRTAWVPETPEQAQGALESVVRRAAHLVRRGRWLRRLSASTLLWQPAGDRPSRLLVFDEGRVVRADDAPSGTVRSREGCGDLPAPPGWPRSRLRRLEGFDAATHDRLRVLTTELRRLVAGGRDVRLRLDPRTCLDRDALARRLFWV